ncbi:hypothetical protein SAMN05421827_107120 [Pedobacter terrae]|uniref:Lipoprotein n=1 Tax=Pedobacter terrae TaxID=405671 RepID=A0A1G7UU07_9SPHI|nr:hypothetical protein [Pedobacter terrae]SDG51022.1 hypothetical protein SAMN05421827_107120 [Pedobacter terrae]
MVKHFKHSFCTFLLSTAITGCMGQVKPIGQAPLNLIDINFNTPVTSLYPEKYKSEQWDNYFNIPVGDETRMVQRDTTFINEFSKDQRAIGVEYRQKSSSSGDTLAIANKQSFSSLSIAASLDGKIKAIGAEVDDITDKDAKDFIAALTNNYGKSKKLEGSFISKFTIYEWEAKDRIFRYSTIFKDEKNTLKLSIDKEAGTIESMDRIPHHDGYFFVINKAFINDLKTLRTGLFVYIK